MFAFSVRERAVERCDGVVSTYAIEPNRRPVPAWSIHIVADVLLTRAPHAMFGRF